MGIATPTDRLGAVRHLLGPRFCHLGVQDGTSWPAKVRVLRFWLPTRGQKRAEDRSRMVTKCNKPSKMAVSGSEAHANGRPLTLPRVEYVTGTHPSGTMPSVPYYWCVPFWAVWSPLGGPPGPEKNESPYETLFFCTYKKKKWTKKSFCEV